MWLLLQGTFWLCTYRVIYVSDLRQSICLGVYQFMRVILLEIHQTYAEVGCVMVYVGSRKRTQAEAIQIKPH